MQADGLARYVHAYGGHFPNCERFFSDLGLPSSVGFRHLLYVLSRGGTSFFPGTTPHGFLILTRRNARIGRRAELLAK